MHYCPFPSIMRENKFNRRKPRPQNPRPPRPGPGGPAPDPPNTSASAAAATTNVNGGSSGHQFILKTLFRKLFFSCTTYNVSRSSSVQNI